MGDVVVVVTRYFGGTKLGTGGLVRAYSEAVREVLAALPRAERVPTHTALVALPYGYLERVRRAVSSHGGELLDEGFAGDVTVTARFPIDWFPAFQRALQEMSAGQLDAVVVESGDSLVPIRGEAVGDSREE